MSETATADLLGLSSSNDDDRSKQYNSRLARARTANLERRGTGKSMLSPRSDESQLSSPSQTAAEDASVPPNDDQPAAAEEQTPAPSEYLLVQPSEQSDGAHWCWNNAKQMLALVDSAQQLKIVSEHGKVLYRVQLPEEGRTIFLGWEESGVVLAAVQKLGGAFLWFPSKPGTVQQWEGMQFSSKILKNSVLKRNSHFDTCFACWSTNGKLVLGLADGNFAVWDLGSNETFMSRKHFAGKHTSAIQCGAWNVQGEHLALTSSTQLKVSRPMNNASWEATAAKLTLNGEDVNFHDLKFSISGSMLAALAGSSVFRHLCLYKVSDGGKSGAKVEPVGEMQPSSTIGALQATIWLENDILAVVTSGGFVRLIRYDDKAGVMIEDDHYVCESGVTDAKLLKSSGHIVCVNQEFVIFFDPLLCSVAATVPLPPFSKSIRVFKLQLALSFVVVSRSDGALMKVAMPSLSPIDLSLLAISSKSSELATLSSAKSPSCRSPSLLGMVSSTDGASHSSHQPLYFAWSVQSERLAVINSKAELIVYARPASGLQLSRTLQQELPQAQCVFLAWDPSTERHLGFALRGHGLGLWQVDTEGGVNMWSGMTYKNNLFKLSSEVKGFDPLFGCWSQAGQLALGNADGTFAVWDSVSSQVSVSQKSGKHNTSITAGAWLSSFFAPALALASTSMIKVSQGFENAEWGSTALKLKLPTSSRNSGSALQKLRGRLDPEGLRFLELSFSASGKFLAALSAPTNNPESKQVIVYELQDVRQSLVAVREVMSSDSAGAPFKMSWLADDALLVFSKSTSSSSISSITPLTRGREVSWPAPGQSPPGTMLDAAATKHGLIAAAFHTSNADGVVVIMGYPKMTMLAEMPNSAVPRCVRLHENGSDNQLVLSFDEGGVEVWQL